MKKAPDTATVKKTRKRLLPATGEQEASAFLFLAAITSILSLLIFQEFQRLITLSIDSFLIIQFPRWEDHLSALFSICKGKAS